MQPTKVKELWRNPDGSFAKAPEPVKTETVVPRNHQADIGVFLLAASMVLLAVVYWYVLIPTIAVAGLSHATHKHFKQNRLVINYY